MENYNTLPDVKTLQKICKAISMLDAIICQDWQFRYYSYNSKWNKDEEFFEMRNGQGEHLLILFKNNACVINGVHSEYELEDKDLLTKGLPKIFYEFIFGEPIKSRGTNFCIWTDEQGNWLFNNTNNESGAKELLYIFDDIPQTYINWAEEYFEKDDLSLETVKKIYNNETLTMEMVQEISSDLDDWDLLKQDIIEIDYPCNFI